MNILIIGKDYSIFSTGDNTTEDSQQRHLTYARHLRKFCGNSSSVRVISYSPRRFKHKVISCEDLLFLYPTRSIHRTTFLLDVILCLRRVMNHWRPDLITSQTPWEEGIIGFLVSRLIGCRFVAQLHIDIFSTFWIEETLLNKLKYWLAAWVCKRSDGIRVVSKGLARNVVSHLRVPPDRVHVVPVGVSFKPVDPNVSKDYYKRKIAEELAGRPVVLYVGRFYEPKNLVEWIDVAERVSSVVPDARFVMVGDGPLYARISSIVASRQLNSRVYLLGAVAYEQLRDIYAAADVFLLTSKYESYGRVIVEALLSGVPVVSTRCVGPEDLIDDGLNGFLVDTGDIDGLASAVTAIILDDRKRNSMRKNILQGVTFDYDLETLSKQLVTLWLSVAKHEG